MSQTSGDFSLTLPCRRCGGHQNGPSLRFSSFVVRGCSSCSRHSAPEAYPRRFRVMTLAQVEQLQYGLFNRVHGTFPSLGAAKVSQIKRLDRSCRPVRHVKRGDGQFSPVASVARDRSLGTPTGTYTPFATLPRGGGGLRALQSRRDRRRVGPKLRCSPGDRIQAWNDVTARICFSLTQRASRFPAPPPHPVQSSRRRARYRGTGTYSGSTAKGAGVCTALQGRFYQYDALVSDHAVAVGLFDYGEV